MVKVIDRRNKSMGGGSKRDVSRIKNIAIHYSATKEGSTSAFERFWKNDRGWVTGGYHEVVLLNGDVELNYDPGVISNGVKNHNTATYNICYVGAGQPNAKQRKALVERIAYNKKRFNVADANVKGHREFSGASTSCPAVNVQGLLKGGEQSNKPPASKPSKPSTGTYKGNSVVDYLKHQKQDSSFSNRAKLAKKHGIKNYKGTESQNTKLLNALRGKKTKPKPSKNKYPLPNGELKVGSRGEGVKQLQRALNAANFKVGKVDGIYGAKTKDGVTRFQSVHDAYNVDGVYGPRTKTRLDKVVN